MRTKHILLAALIIVLLLTATQEAPAEVRAPWRSTAELPGYPYFREDPWAWKNMLREVGTAARMYFGEHWRGMRPIVNFYIEGDGCRDPEALRIYRRYMEDAVELLTAYRDWFVENYPQFSYLKKLRLQVGNGIVERALNIPVEIVEGCYSSGVSTARQLVRVRLTSPGGESHEFTHAMGADEICLGGLPERCESPYYGFWTIWGGTGDIGMNTITWYALALSWSWLYFYDEHPGTASDDYASKLPNKPKYTTLYTGRFQHETFRTEVEYYIYVVTLEDMLESGVMPRRANNVAELRLGGGAVIPTLSLWPEDWMRDHAVLDYVDKSVITHNGRVYPSLLGLNQVGLALSRGFAVGYESFSPWNPLYDHYVHVEAGDVRDYLNLLDIFNTLFIMQQPWTAWPWTDAKNLQYLLFPDLRPDLHFCGYAYRWRGQRDEKVLFSALYGNGSFRPSLRPGESLTYKIPCYYEWGPYVYRAPSFYFQEEPIPTERDIFGREYYRGIYVILGVPASEKIVQDSPGTRRVFSGVWLVNGTEWPGPYLDLDVLGWRIQGEPPERRPHVTGRVPGASIQPGWWPSITLYYQDGRQPMYLDGFTQRYRGFEKVPWMTGVTFLKLRHNTTAEPLYYREHLVNFTVPEGFRVLDGNATGWYKEGSRIKLPRLSNLTVSEGTMLVHEGWRSRSGEIYGPGEELVVEGPVSLEPILVRYHRVSVRGPPEGVKAAGEGWYREGSTATLRLLENVTYVGERTRIVVHGFRAGNETPKEVSLRVDAPVVVEAVWERQHLLTVKSRFYNWSFENPWYTENTTYMIVLPGDLQNLGNGTMIEVRGVEVVSGGERFVGTRLELQTVNVTVGGSGYIALWNVSFTVRGPPEMRVHWTVRHAVEVSAPPGLASFEGLQSAAPPATVYAEEGERLVINLLQQESVNETRYVLRDVFLGNNSLGPVTRIEVDVTAPTRIVAVYRVQLLVWPRLRGPDGSVAEPDLVVLRSGLGEASSTGGSALWLDSYVTGPPFEWVEWRLVKAVYRGVEVAVDQALTPKAPGALYISAPIARLKVSVRDVFGMPVPLAHVSCDCPGGTAVASAGTAGVAELGVVPHGKVTLRAMLLFRAEREVRVPEEGAELVLPISPYTAGIAASLAPPIYVGVRRWRRGSSPRP
jgi:hypothetical protein